MICPSCGYVMSDFDKECPRCHGKGIPKSTQQASPQPAPSQSTPTQNLSIWDYINHGVFLLLVLFSCAAVPFLYAYDIRLSEPVAWAIWLLPIAWSVISRLIRRLGKTRS